MLEDLRYDVSDLQPLVRGPNLLRMRTVVPQDAPKTFSACVARCKHSCVILQILRLGISFGKMPRRSCCGATRSSTKEIIPCWKIPLLMSHSPRRSLRNYAWTADQTDVRPAGDDHSSMELFLSDGNFPSTIENGEQTTRHLI